MSIFDTTSTAQTDSYMTEATAATNYGTSQDMILGGSAGNRHRLIIGFRVPDAPLGADALQNVYLTLGNQGWDGGATIQASAFSVSKLWVETGVTWNNYDTSAAWSAAGGDLGNQVGSMGINTAASSMIDISGLGLSWGGHGSIILKDNADTALNYFHFYTVNSPSTIAQKPHIVARYVNNPPPAITDLTITPDLSLSEATAAYRVSPVLRWTGATTSRFAKFREQEGLTHDIRLYRNHPWVGPSRNILGGNTQIANVAQFARGYQCKCEPCKRNGSRTTVIVKCDEEEIFRFLHQEFLKIALESLGEDWAGQCLDHFWVHDRLIGESADPVSTWEAGLFDQVSTFEIQHPDMRIDSEQFYNVVQAYKARGLKPSFDELMGRAVLDLRNRYR